MMQASPVSCQFLPEILLTLWVWILYGYTLRCDFVSDDVLGVASYNGKLQGLEYGMVSRWLRYHLCGADFPSGVKSPAGVDVPQGKIPWRHHLLSVLVFNLAVIAGFNFLKSLFGVETAFLTMALFAAHPVGTQGVAWISGLGYPLSLLWMFAGLNLISFYKSIPDPTLIQTVLVLGLFAVISFLAINALFIGLMFWLILLLLGHYPFALIAATMSAILGAQIVRHTISYRTHQFKLQEMSISTKPSARKIVVALKTLLYYISHSVFPSKMGLYHEWGFHYSKSVEKEDWMFLGGLVAFAGLLALAIYHPALEVRFGVAWFLAFIVIFLNWITIQQFVTERYVLIPSLGTCLVVVHFTKDFLPIYAFILGVSTMRLWAHLPTYDNELRFYLSNVWNFPKSEVAYGNLGVTYMHAGLAQSGMDCWLISSKLNPDYDVPYYNTYSAYRSNGQFMIEHGNFQQGFELMQLSVPFLEKCMTSKICHFKKKWTKELADLKADLAHPVKVVERERKRQMDILKPLQKRIKKPKDAKDAMGIQQSIIDVSTRIAMIDALLAQAKKKQPPMTPVPVPPAPKPGPPSKPKPEPVPVGTP